MEITFPEVVPSSEEGNRGLDLSRIPRKEFGSPYLLGPSRGGGRGAHLQLARAAVLDEWRESCQLQLGVRLQLVSHQVGHLGHVVAEVLAHGDADGVAAPLLLVPEAQCRPLEQEQEQERLQQQPHPDASRRPRDARPCAPPGHGQSRGQQRRGLLQQTPPVCTGAPVAALLPAPDRESSKAPRATRGQRPPLQQLYETVRDIRRPEPGQRDGLLGSWLQAAIPEPGAGRVRLFGEARLHSTPRCSHRPSAPRRWRFAGRGWGGTDNMIVQ